MRLFYSTSALVLLCVSLFDLNHTGSSFTISRSTFSSPSTTMNSSLQIMALSDENTTDNDNEHDSHTQSRRTWMTQVTRSTLLVLPALLSNPQISQAGIDPSLLKTYQVEGDTNGSMTRINQLVTETSKSKPEDLVNIPWDTLPSGVSYREYRSGSTSPDEKSIQNGSKIAVEMTIRCKSFATANEPGGVKYFSTKDDTDFNELAWTVGSGEMLPGLEEAMMGMKKGGVRRIEVPSTMVFQARKDGQLPLPKDSNKDGKRRFENLFKTDATLLFEVLVTRVK